MAKVTIERRQEIFSTEATRAGKKDLIISYRDEKGVVGIVVVPIEGNVESNIKDAIRADLAKRAALEGKTLEL